MRLDQLEYFTKAAELESITNAASHLFITQQAISTAIKNLETELQTTLLLRNHNGVTLTSDGEYLYQKAKEILAAAEDVTQHFSITTAPQWQGKLTIAVNNNVKKHYLPPLVSYFHKSCPKVTLEYLPASNEEIISLVDGGKADIGLLVLAEVDLKPLQTLPEDMIFQFFSKYTYGVQLNRSSPLAQCNTLSMNTIAKQTIILDAEWEYPLFSDIIRLFNPQPDILVAEGFPLAEQFIRDNLGLRFVPLSIDVADKGLVTIPISNSVKTYAGYIKKRSTDADEILLDFFIQKLLAYHL